MPAIAGKKRLAEREFMALPALPGSQSMVQPWWMVATQKSYSRGGESHLKWGEAGGVWLRTGSVDGACTLETGGWSYPLF